MATVRQRIDKVQTIDELVKLAIMGQWSSNDGSNPDVSYKTIFADSPTLSSGTDTEIWPAGTDMGTPSSAEVLDIVSSSIQDDAGGTGMDAVFIEGLDGDFLPIQELVVLNGTGTVNSSNSYIHVYEINCLNLTTSGTTNAGNITITNTTSGDTLGYVAASDSISKHGQFLVPAGYNAIMLGGHYSVYRSSGTGERRAEIDLFITPLDGGLGNGVTYKTLKLGGSSSAGVSTVDFSIPLVLGQKVFIHPHANAEANNTIVSFEYSLLLVKETIDIDSIF